MKNRAQTMTDEQVETLRGLGWDFVPTGPNEFDWLLFGAGKVIAHAGGAHWAHALMEIGVLTEAVGGDPEHEIWEATLELRWYHPGCGRVEPQPVPSIHWTPRLQQKWRRVAGGPLCNGGSTEWRDVPSVDAQGRPIQ